MNFSRKSLRKKLHHEMILLTPEVDNFVCQSAESALMGHRLSWRGAGGLTIFLFGEQCSKFQNYFPPFNTPRYCWSEMCPSASIFGILGLKLRNQLQFKCDLEQNTFWNLTLASQENQSKYVEIEEHNMESDKSELSHFRPEVEIERSNTQLMKSLLEFWDPQQGEY
jgi:hypothetical protein